MWLWQFSYSKNYPPVTLSLTWPVLLLLLLLSFNVPWSRGKSVNNPWLPICDHALIEQYYFIYFYSSKLLVLGSLKLTILKSLVSILNSLSKVKGIVKEQTKIRSYKVVDSNNIFITSLSLWIQLALSGKDNKSEQKIHSMIWPTSADKLSTIKFFHVLGCFVFEQANEQSNYQTIEPKSKLNLPCIRFSCNMIFLTFSLLIRNTDLSWKYDSIQHRADTSLPKGLSVHYNLLGSSCPKIANASDSQVKPTLL